MNTNAKRRASVHRVDAAFAALLIVATLLFWVFGFAPIAERRASVTEQERSRDDFRTLVKEGKVGVRILEKQLLELRQETERNQFELQPIGRLNQRLDALTGLMASCQLQINAVKTGRGTDHKHCSVLPVTVEGIGSYPRCAGFMRQLHTQFCDCAVSAFDTQSTGVAGQTARFRLELQLFLASPDTRSAVASATGGRTELPTDRPR